MFTCSPFLALVRENRGKKRARTAFSPKRLFGVPPAGPPRGVQKAPLIWPNARPRRRRKIACETNTETNQNRAPDGAMRGASGRGEGKPSGFADQSKFHARVLQRSLALLAFVQNAGKVRRIPSLRAFRRPHVETLRL